MKLQVKVFRKKTHVNIKKGLEVRIVLPFQESPNSQYYNFMPKCIKHKLCNRLQVIQKLTFEYNKLGRKISSQELNHVHVAVHLLKTGMQVNLKPRNLHKAS